MLKAAVTLGLALLLCTAAAPGAAAAESDFCPGADSGLAGGYSTLDEVPAEVVDASVAYFVENLAANITNWAPCDADELQVSAAGCSQVVAGTNYEVQLNVTCPVAGTGAVGLQAALFQPLPYTGEPIQVEDMQVLFVSDTEGA